MGIVVALPLKIKAVHVRASAVPLAPSRASISPVTPASRATAASKIGAHHSDGIRSLCAHLRAAGTLAPMSPAIAAGEGHKPMTSLNEAIATGAGASSTMDSLLGQSVLNSKANVSYDCGKHLRDYAVMADRMSETEEKLAFIGRVKLARMTRYETQKPMLTILGVDQGTYKQYETRTPLPYRFIPKFCAATGVDIDWLLTGEGKGPAIVEPPRVVPKRAARAKRRRAA